MYWNWQEPDWPDFQWDSSALAEAESRFLLGAGVVLGSTAHMGKDETRRLLVEVMSGEALTTSAIEGEILSRDSVQSSIQRHFGLIEDRRRISPAEEGISEMMVQLYRTFAEPLTKKTLFLWHKNMNLGRRDLTDIGRYRTSQETMQIVSGAIGHPRIHFQAPPSNQVPAEMDRYISWFNRTAPGAEEPLPALTRAGIAHLYFESIHPFEDGNGRLGRALAEKAIAQCLGQPILTALSTTILARQASYYTALEQANKKNEVTPWLDWFALIALESQRRSIAQVEFLIAKAKLLERLNGQINDRQRKALLRVFREGPAGFKGGLSAEKYSTITGASPATTTRDLADLTEKGVLTRTGERKGTRYAVNLDISN